MALRPANVSLMHAYVMVVIHADSLTVVTCFFFLFCSTYALIKPPARTTISSVCPKCGMIAKSGKISCCGRGGSWFRHCGSSGNAKLDHTWYEGIQACKSRSQSKAIIGQRLEQKGIDSSHGDDMTNYTVIVNNQNCLHSHQLTPQHQ